MPKYQPYTKKELNQIAEQLLTTQASAKELLDWVDTLQDTAVDPTGSPILEPGSDERIKLEAAKHYVNRLWTLAQNIKARNQ